MGNNFRPKRATPLELGARVMYKWTHLYSLTFAQKELQLFAGWLPQWERQWVIADLLKIKAISSRHWLVDTVYLPKIA